jgi:hypothetical protein
MDLNISKFVNSTTKHKISKLEIFYIFVSFIWKNFFLIIGFDKKKMFINFLKEFTYESINSIYCKDHKMDIKNNNNNLKGKWHQW